MTRRLTFEEWVRHSEGVRLDLGNPPVHTLCATVILSKKFKPELDITKEYCENCKHRLIRKARTHCAGLSFEKSS